MAKKTDYLAPQNKGLIQDLIFQLKLIWRLMNDPRVNGFLKLLPIAALVYLISPFDLLPGLALPVVGAIDDAAALWLGGTLFLALCPEEVVEEHRNALLHVIPAQARDVPLAEREKAIEQRRDATPTDADAPAEQHNERNGNPPDDY